MRKISFIAMLALAVVSLASCRSSKQAPPATDEGKCAVLAFQYGSNVTAEEAKDITDIFRVSFRPARYTVEDYDRVGHELESRGYTNKQLTKHQMCEVGRSLGAKLVVAGTISKLMDEYSVDVRVINVVKETTVAFEGSAFSKPDCSTEMQNIGRRLAAKMK